MQRLMGRRVNNGGIMGREVDRRMGGWVNVWEERWMYGWVSG